MGGRSDEIEHRAEVGGRRGEEAEEEGKEGDVTFVTDVNGFVCVL